MHLGVRLPNENRVRHQPQNLHLITVLNYRNLNTYEYPKPEHHIQVFDLSCLSYNMNPIASDGRACRYQIDLSITIV